MPKPSRRPCSGRLSGAQRDTPGADSEASFLQRAARAALYALRRCNRCGYFAFARSSCALRARIARWSTPSERNRGITPCQGCGTLLALGAAQSIVEISFYARCPKPSVSDSRAGKSSIANALSRERGLESHLLARPKESLQ